MSFKGRTTARVKQPGQRTREDDLDRTRPGRRSYREQDTSGQGVTLNCQPLGYRCGLRVRYCIAARGPRRAREFDLQG
jgi:hypothetical protein